MVFLIPVMGRAEEPISAIDWLSNSVTIPAVLPAPSTQSAPNGDQDIVTNALPEKITTQTLGRPSPDELGLLPSSVTGLPDNLWGSSTSADIARRLTTVGTDLLPALRELLHTVVLAELDPPKDTTPRAALFLARVDTLLLSGSLDKAAALMELVSPMTPEIFQRYFDTTLFIGNEDDACKILRATPALSSTYPARIFCLARGGDWDAAALTLETAEALNLVSPKEDALLARFLDPSLAEDVAPLEPPKRPTPLTFRMYEAIGEPLNTSDLPLAFAHSDLRSSSGWKAQVNAAERLARVGGLDTNRLMAVFTERLPAASGGVWERVEAIQRLDAALTTADPSAVASALPAAWQAMKEAKIEVPVATALAERLVRLPLQGDMRSLAFRIGLLSPEYESIANSYEPANAKEAFLVGLAKGTPPGPVIGAPFSEPISKGFSTTQTPVRLQSLIREDRLGEAILRAIALFTAGAKGDFDELSDAISFFRSIGMEDTARRASLEIMILDRRE